MNDQRLCRPDVSASKARLKRGSLRNLERLGFLIVGCVFSCDGTPRPVPLDAGQPADVAAEVHVDAVDSVSADLAGDPDTGCGTPEVIGDDAGRPAQIRVNCCGVPPYALGTRYQGLEYVQNIGRVYQCRPYPYAGFCGLDMAYAPGVGYAWQDAWVHVAYCL